MEYIILIMVSTIIDYYAGIKMGESQNVATRRRYLILSLISNLGILFAFKYFNFFNDSIRTMFNHFNIFYGVSMFRVLLPVGISFYTFQTLSYSIDVYRGIKKPEKNLGIFALYVSFFPQLVAGPIERSTRLLPQFFEKHDFNYARVTDGLKLMLWGFFKKVVIADRLAILVNTVYNSPSNYTGFPLILATVFFAFQIYCDFSGYCDIAIGGAQVLGFNLMDNFNRPYFSKSISEFWKRWHISLSTWFKDYLYISLGGNRVVKWRWQFNLLLTFLISGLWHGANWTYVIWGGLHGFYFMFSIWTNKIRKNITNFIGINKFPRFYKYTQVLTTFSLVCFAWIFFRARNVNEAFYVVIHIFDGFGSMLNIKGIGSNFTGLGFGRYDYLVAFASIGFMQLVHLIQRHGRIRHMLSERPTWMRWTFYYLLVMWIVLFGVFNKSQFIYFQF